VTPSARKRKRKTLRSDVQKQEKNSKLAAKSPPPSIITPPSQEDDRTSVSTLSVSTFSSPASAITPNQKSSSSASSASHRAAAKSKTKNIKLGPTDILHWIRPSGPPASNTTMDSGSFKKAARFLHQPMKRSPSKSKLLSTSGRPLRGAVPLPSSHDLQPATNHDTLVLPSDASNIALDGPMVCPIRRLLLEDILLLQPNVSRRLVLLFNKNVDMFDRLYNLHELSDTPLPMASFGSEHNFFQINVVVTHNPRVGALRDGLLDQNTFIHLLLGNGNEQIMFLCPTCTSTDVDASITIKWRDFFFNKLSLMLFGSIPWQRSFRQVFSKLGPNTKLDLFRQLADEVRFDVALSFDLCSCYETHSVQQDTAEFKRKVVDLAPRSIADFISEGLVGKSIDTLDEMVNASIQQEVEKCYGSFVSWTDSVIDDSVVDSLVTRACELVPGVFDCIQFLLGHSRVQAWESRKHRLVYFRRSAFFQLLGLCRMRNNHRFVWWGIINSAIYYQSSSRALVSSISNFFGLTCTFNTLIRHTQAYCEPSAFRKRVVDALGSQVVTLSFSGDDGTAFYNTTFSVTILVFDNTQKNYRFKWQRGGNSSFFLKLTSSMFWKLWHGSWVNTPLPPTSQLCVPLTYVDQAIPSPIGMPNYESTMEW
jgi:hypothetical protein